MKNDWIIANINNPNLTNADFKNVGGFTVENTQLLPINDYLKSDLIKNNPLFLTNGVFDKLAFTKYYNYQALRYGEFLHTEDLDNYEYGFWDVLQKPNSLVRNPQFNIEKISNPTHQSTGVVGLTILGERTKSDFELAESQKIFDYSTGKFKDESPEDMSLFKNPIKFINNIFSEPLVLAKYEEDIDTIDPLTGQMVHHKAGDNKTNVNGEYYFETLGGRSIMDKQVLSLMDVLTPEDSAVNKYDFFDSDDLEKSAEGVISKNLAAIAPLAFLGPVGSAVYGGILVGKEFLKTLPMLARVATIFSDSNIDSPVLNQLAAYGEKFSGSTSEYSKLHTFSFENFGNLVSDVALQWALLKAIANTVLKLTSGYTELKAATRGKAMALYEKLAIKAINDAYAGKMPLSQVKELTGVTKLDDVSKALQSGTWTESVIGFKSLELAAKEARDTFAKKQKLGQDLSLIYMAMISNTDVYESALEHGATQQEAAMVALGSMIGMFSVDKYLGLGEMFFDDELAKSRRDYRRLLKDHYDSDVAPVILSLALSKITNEPKKGLLLFFKTGKEKTIDFLKNYHSDVKDRALGLFGKSVGEGLEEVSEELVTDLVKSLYEVGGQYGYFTQTDLGAFENMMERYGMSFAGGSIGGAMFGGIEALKNPKTVADTNSREALLTLIRNEGSAGVLRELDRMKLEGKLGSTELSINTLEITSDSGEKQTLFVKADKDNISQNDFNYNLMKSAILLMDKIINANQLNISDDKLFERMITAEIRLSNLRDYLKDISYISGYYQDYLKLVGNIVSIDTQLDDLEKSEDSKKRTDEYERLKQELLVKKEKLLQEKQEFLTNKTLRYFKKTLFATNPALAGMFMPVSFDSYVQREYGIPSKYLDKDDLEKAKIAYDDWVKTKKIEDLDKAYEAYELMSDKLAPVLEEFSESEVEDWEKVRKLITENLPNFSLDTRIESLDINVDEKLDELGIIKSEEYDKPWKSDPSKTNKAYKLLLKENPYLFFEIVKDHEDKYWSIHFKTGRLDGLGTALTEELKNRLFTAAMYVIPEGEYLSTHGELTKGGISGINKFRNYALFRQVGTRTVKTKGNRPIHPKYITADELSDLDFEENYYFAHLTGIENSEDILDNGLKLSAPGLTGTSLLIGSKEGLQEYMDMMRDGRQRHEGSEGFILIKVPKSELTGSNPYEDITDILDNPLLIDSDYIQNYVEVIPTTTPELDIEIPIWQKITGETEEEYNNRNTLLEGETAELFEYRKKKRQELLTELYNTRLISELLKLADNSTIVDPNTFRYIMTHLGIRILDIVNLYKSSIGLERNKSGEEGRFYYLIQDILINLNKDLSNKDDVLDQIKAKIVELLLAPISVPIALVPEEFGDISGIITFADCLTVIDSVYAPDENGVVYPIIEDDFDDEIIQTLISIIGEAQTSSLITLHNTQSSEPFTVFGDYTIVFDSGNTLMINDGDVLDPLNPDHLPIIEALKAEINNRLNEPMFYSKETFDEEVKLNTDRIEISFNNVLRSLQNDKGYKALKSLENKVKHNPPVLKLIKTVATQLGESFGDIESTLLTIYELYDGMESAADFVLNDDQIKALEKALLLIDAASAVIVGASQEDSYGSPWAFNKTVNEWNREHKSELLAEPKELVEISQSLANVSLSSLISYKSEIEQWLKRASRNRINKVRMFEDFDLKFENIKLKFFLDHGDDWLTEDGDNLLEGVKIVSDPKDLVLEYERALYRNALKLIKEGKSLDYIVDAFAKSINWNLAGNLKTTKLNNNIELLTDYDKCIYLISCIGLNPDSFYSNYIKFVEDNKKSIAPLSFLKHSIRILKAFEKDPKIFNDFLRILGEKTKKENFPILSNAIILTGIGGSGKSSVVARSVITDGTLLLGPTTTQTKNLKSINPKANDKTVKDFLSEILDDLYVDGKLRSSLVTEVKVYGENKDGIADISKVKLKKVTNPPKNIVLDEATLVSNAEIQILSKWCELNNVLLILLGDENLNSDLSVGKNIQREFMLSIRVPKMQLSLRDANIWKYENLNTLANLEDKLTDTDTSDETEIVRKSIVTNDLPKFKLKYYFENNTLTGDMLSATLTDDQIKALDGEVKFIGDTSSEAYKKLKDAGKISKAYSLEEIQGQEADYIVCDVDWKSLANLNSGYGLLSFMLNLYTVLTRSKKGSVIIDNGLTGIIFGAAPLSYSTDSVILNDEAIDTFSKKELAWLHSLTLSPDVEDSVEIEPLTPDTEVTVVLPDNEDEDLSEEEEKAAKEEEKSKIIPEGFDGTYPILVYTNFTYLGATRESDGTWTNPNGIKRDVGIFINTSEKISEDIDKKEKANLLYELKGFIMNDMIDLFEENASRELVKQFPIENLKNIKYYVVKELSDPSTHHFVVEGNGLKELPDGTTLYTLLARFKNKDNEECVITLGTLPNPGNLHEDITVDSILYQIDHSEDDAEKDKLKILIKKIEDGSMRREYQDLLTKIIDEREINKPDFTKITALHKVRAYNETTGKYDYFKIRLEEVNSSKSRYNSRASDCVTSPVYVCMDKNDNAAGKAVIFTSSLPIYDPNMLADEYEHQQETGAPATIRRIILSPAGVSFESLFDSRYLDSYTTETGYTFPFEVVPMGIRMYTALHNFRARLRKLNKLVTDKFSDIPTLEKVLKEESRLYTLYKEENKTGSELNFKRWCESQTLENGITLDKIKEVWDFNDNTLSDVKQFRLGYNLTHGVYTRNIKDGLVGNYINPTVAQLYLGTVELIFKVVLDKVIPPESINANDLIDYKISEEKFKDKEDNWVKHIKKDSEILFNIVEGDKVVPIKIGSEDRIKVIPLLITLLTKNLQARQRMDDPDTIFEGYDVTESENHYQLLIDGEPIPYLDILKNGGLGDIRKDADILPGIIEPKEGLKNSDIRLLNMFNIAFHGTVATGTNDFVKTVGNFHADEVLFGKGMFVDPLLAGKRDDSRKYRKCAVTPKFWVTNYTPGGAKTFIDLSPASETIKPEKKTVTDSTSFNIDDYSTSDDIETLAEMLEFDNIDLFKKFFDTIPTWDKMSLEDFKKSAETSLQSYINASKKTFFASVANLDSFNASLDTLVDASFITNKVTTLKEYILSIGEIINVLQVSEGLVLTNKEGKTYLLDTDFNIIDRSSGDSDVMLLSSINDILELDEIQDDLTDDQLNKLYQYLEDTGIDINLKYDSFDLLEDAWSDILNDLRSKYETIADVLEDGYTRAIACS